LSATNGTFSGNTTVAGTSTFTGDVTVGDGSAADKKILFDGNAQDYHIGLDDSTDSLTIGLGSALGTTPHMIFDANGIITKPLQPAFWVRPASEQSNLALNSTITVLWGTETYDQNADFASNTFTAPVTGKYFMHARVTVQSIDSAASYYNVNMTTSNATHQLFFDPRGFDADTNLYPFNVTAVADMDASDTATITIKQPNGTAQTDILHTGTYSSWYGYLLG
jgi:hypothetical protein